MIIPRAVKDGTTSVLVRAPDAVKTVRETRKNAGGTWWVGCKREPFSAYFSGIGDEFDAENGQNGKPRPGR